MVAHTYILSIIDSVIPDLVAGLMADGVQSLHLYLALDTPSRALLVCPVLQRLPHAVKDKDRLDTPRREMPAALKNLKSDDIRVLVDKNGPGMLRDHFVQPHMRVDADGDPTWLPLGEVSQRYSAPPPANIGQQPDYTHGRFFAVGLLAMIYEGLDIHLGGTCEAGSEVDCSRSS